jgi:hypothetical protein
VRRCAAKVVFECGDSWCVGDIADAGARGVPGSAIVILAATLSAVPAIPAIGLVLVLSVDWFVGIARAVGNLNRQLRGDRRGRGLGERSRSRQGEKSARRRRGGGDRTAGVSGRGRSLFVMAGLVQAIHVSAKRKKDVDARDKRGHDELCGVPSKCHPPESAAGAAA